MVPDGCPGGPRQLDEASEEAVELVGGDLVVVPTASHRILDVVGVVVADADEQVLATTRSRAAQPGVERLVRSEEHTSELQSLMRNSYAVFCSKKKKHRSDSETPA